MLTKIATIANSSNCDCFDLRICTIGRSFHFGTRNVCEEKIKFLRINFIFFNFEYKNQPFLTTQLKSLQTALLVLVVQYSHRGTSTMSQERLLVWQERVCEARASYEMAKREYYRLVPSDGNRNDADSKNGANDNDDGENEDAFFLSNMNLAFELWYSATKILHCAQEKYATAIIMEGLLEDEDHVLSNDNDNYYHISKWSYYCHLYFCRNTPIRVRGGRYDRLILRDRKLMWLEAAKNERKTQAQLFEAVIFTDHINLKESAGNSSIESLNRLLLIDELYPRYGEEYISHNYKKFMQLSSIAKELILEAKMGNNNNKDCRRKMIIAFEICSYKHSLNVSTTLKIFQSLSIRGRHAIVYWSVLYQSTVQEYHDKYNDWESAVEVEKLDGYYRWYRNFHHACIINYNFNSTLTRSSSKSGEKEEEDDLTGGRAQIAIGDAEIWHSFYGNN
jgi:hypothetical protein